MACRRLPLGMHVVGFALLLGFGMTSYVRGEDAPNKYVGAERCKNCHSAAAKGDQYGCWTKMKHAKAFQTLGTDEAKKVGAAKGVADPQTADACLSCHVTAFGVPAEQKHKKFDQTQGVQCESCHGPAGNHVAARLAADESPDPTKVQTVGKDEIKRNVPYATCITCHNEKSPSYKPICIKKAAKEISHLDPRRGHPANYLETLDCGCPACKK